MQGVFVNSSCSTCLTINETGLTRSAATSFLMRDLILAIVRAPAAGLHMDVRSVSVKKAHNGFQHFPVLKL